MHSTSYKIGDKGLGYYEHFVICKMSEKFLLLIERKLSSLHNGERFEAELYESSVACKATAQPQAFNHLDTVSIAVS